MRRNHNRGFTLIETVLSMAAMSLLLGAVLAGVALTTTALPASHDAGMADTREVQAIERLVNELSVATGFTTLTTAEVTFTVPDRDNDSNPEVIRYHWSGVPGEPLIRQYNSRAAVKIVDNLSEFKLEPLTQDHDGKARVHAILVLCHNLTKTTRVAAGTALLSTPEVP